MMKAREWEYRVYTYINENFNSFKNCFIGMKNSFLFYSFLRRNGILLCTQNLKASFMPIALISTKTLFIFNKNSSAVSLLIFFDENNSIFHCTIAFITFSQKISPNTMYSMTRYIKILNKSSLTSNLKI